MVFDERDFSEHTKSMTNLLKGFFTQTKQTPDAAPPITASDTITPTPKPAPIRGPGGKFVSKKPVEKKVVAEDLPAGKAGIAASSPEASPRNDKENAQKEKEVTQQTITFYGSAIRKWHIDTAWYFSLTDILTIAKIIDISAYINELQQNETTSKTLLQNSKIISLPKDDGTEEKVLCVTYENFMQILPILRSKESTFPGPFPDWLADIANIPAQ